MTTLYRPVLIESAEQAEALPEGTVALQSWGHGTTARTLTNGRWITPSGSALPHAEVVGMQALVPIEAEEETSVVFKAAGFQDTATHPYSEASMDSDGNVWFGDGLNRVDVTEEFNEWAKQHTRTRYVTPWEEA